MHQKEGPLKFMLDRIPVVWSQALGTGQIVFLRDGGRVDMGAGKKIS